MVNVDLLSSEAGVNRGTLFLRNVHVGHRIKRGVNRSIFVLLLVELLVINRPATANDKEAGNTAFAVVELFSSEGCSSCPPADKVLAGLVAEAKKDGSRIFALEFHVDYWDRLGWKDPFSLPLASERQEQYASVRKSTDIYTPQMIVNGTEVFVGSDRARAWKAVESALAHPVQTVVTMHAFSDPDGWKVNYQVKGVAHGATICVALVESELVSQVRRGENTGSTLTHANVVREFVSQPLDETGDGRVTIKAKTTGPTKNCQFIAFVQDSRAMTILGATGLTLPQSGKSKGQLEPAQ